MNRQLRRQYLFNKDVTYFRWSKWGDLKYFKVDHINRRVFQVVVKPGGSRQGRIPKAIGIFQIAYITFIGNYFTEIATQYLRPCEKKEFTLNAKLIIKQILK